VNADSVDFDQNTTDVLNVHVMNSLVFVAVGAVIVVAVAFFGLRRKRIQQRETATSA
jgi:hypothetical protein